MKIDSVSDAFDFVMKGEGEVERTFGEFTIVGHETFYFLKEAFFTDQSPTSAHEGGDEFVEAAEGGVEDIAFHFVEGVFFDLANALTSDGKFLADFFKGAFALAIEVEAFGYYFLLFFGKKEEEILDDFVNLRQGFDNRSLATAKHKL